MKAAQESVHPKVARRKAALAVLVMAVFMALCLAVMEAIAWAARSVNSTEGTVVAVEDSFTLPEEPFYVLLIGSDTRKGTALYTGKANEHAQVDQHSDIMTLVRVDVQDAQLSLVTVPRDTRLEGESQKINDALAQDNDPEAVVYEVEKLTGVEVSYYLMIDFIGFEQLVDAMGGLVVDVPITISVPDPSTAQEVEVQAGTQQLLDGSEALVLARARKEYGANQDALRQVNVRQLEVAIIEKGIEFYLESGSEGETFTYVLDALLGNVQTNMDSELVAALIGACATADNLTIYTCTGPYDGDYADDGLWVVEEDKELWAQLMAVVDAGEDPTGIVEEPQFSTESG